MIPNRTLVIARCLEEINTSRNQGRKRTVSAVLPEILKSEGFQDNPLNYPGFFELIGEIISQEHEQRKNKFPKKGTETPDNACRHERVIQDQLI